MGVVLFDMDRTLVPCNTMGRFLRHEFQRGRIGAHQMAAVMFWRLQYRWGRLNAHAAAERIIGWYEGESEEYQRRNVRDWFERHVASLVSPRARQSVEQHRRAGDRLVLVSVTHHLICEHVAANFGIEDVLCTRLEVRDQKLTGRIVPPLCFGSSKVECVQQFLRQNGYAWGDTVAYSDSISDLPLLTAAHTAVAVNPDGPLRRQARARHWRVEYWT
jgi:putative phosphoserine phosphatase/1-acylglycerol-3-phosphate O-acyltransferase